MKTLWQRACEIIPGGNQIVSKRPNRYCPGKYPSHYSWAHGNEVIDAETGIKYKDYSTMGVGSCILGYGNPEIDAAVIQSIAAGNMSSLNSIEELELAEELLKISPKMQMVRFARTGGEACAIAERIAKVYHPGELSLHHGYSGWILGSPEKSWNGLQFNSAEDLELMEGIIENVSYIIMEPVRNYPEQSLELLKATRKFATKWNIPLIFDEITSGFRTNIGGWHATKNIYPDIAVYGKALGNGYAISAIVGTAEVMQSAEKSFVSSTFWSERTGFAAALASLEYMKKNRVQDKLIQQGKDIQGVWNDLSDMYGLDMEVHGIYPLSGFTFVKGHDEKCTYLTQEGLKRGLLLTDQFYTSIAHNKEDIDRYIYNLDQILPQIAEGTFKVEGAIRDKGWRRAN